MTRKHDDDLPIDPAARFVHVLLEEELAGRQPERGGDLATAWPTTAGDGARTDARRSRWLAAAILLLGLCVTSFFLLRPSNAVPAALDATQPQDPQSQPVKPKDMADFLRLLEQAIAIRFVRFDMVGATHSGQVDRLDLVPWPETQRVEGDALREWRAAITASAATREGHNSVTTALHAYVDLPGSRHVEVFVQLGDKDRLVPPLQDEGDPIVPNAELTRLLAATNAEFERLRRMARGEASSAAQLAELPSTTVKVDVPALPAAVLREQLGRFIGLRALRVRAARHDGGDHPDAATLALLAELPATRPLVHLDLAAQALADADLAGLAALRSLESLHLRGAGAGVTGPGIAVVTGAPLRELGLWDCTGLTSAGLRALAKPGNVRALWLVDCDLGSDPAALDVLAMFGGLRELRLRSRAFTDAHVPALLRTKLAKLTLVDAGATGEGLARLQALPSLRELHLVGLKIGDSDVDHLATLRTLRRLQMTSSDLQHQLSQGSIDTLRAALPGCEVVAVPGSRVWDTRQVLERAR